MMPFYTVNLRQIIQKNMTANNEFPLLFKTCIKLHGYNILGLRSTVQFSGSGRSRPACTAGIYDGPMRVIHHVDCAELEPVNQNTQTSIIWRHI